MKNNALLRMIALLLALTMLLCGCDSTPKDTSPTTTTQTTDSTPPEPEEPEIDPWDAPKFEDMEYTRPDVDALEDAMETCNTLIDGNDSQALLDALNIFAELSSNFTTNYHLAHIHYNLNLKDEDWEKEYNYCNDYVAQFQSGTDNLLHALAASKHRDFLEEQEDFGEGYFDKYDGESMWTDTFTELMSKEDALSAEFYELSSEGGEYDELAQLLVEMVLLRQEIAAEAGYEDYPSFAYDFYYDRDYSVDEVKAYLEDVREELVPLVAGIYEDTEWTECIKMSSSSKAYDYVEELAEEAGGVIAEAFRLMDEKELYHIRSKLNKLDASFEVFLPDYMVPFVFVSPMGANIDHLTLTHEFGHFCNDYASSGHQGSIDVAEIFSQGLEFLSLCYVNDDLAPYQAVASLMIYTEQGAFADFELRIYDLEPEDVTAANIEKIFGEICEDYNLSYDAETYTAINHFFTSPLYVISYVVSNDAALQLYQMELDEEGAGLACYIDNLDSEVVEFLAFMESAGLRSPFTPGRIQEVREILENGLS